MRSNAFKQSGNTRAPYHAQPLVRALHARPPAHEDDHGHADGGTESAPRVVIELSERECEILRWTALGKTSDEVAMILGLTTRTVNFHITRILVKLDSKNKIQAAVKALRLHLIHLVWYFDGGRRQPSKD